MFESTVFVAAAVLNHVRQEWHHKNVSNDGNAGWERDSCDTVYMRGQSTTFDDNTRMSLCEIISCMFVVLESH